MKQQTDTSQESTIFIIVLFYYYQELYEYLKQLQQRHSFKNICLFVLNAFFKFKVHF